MNTLSEVKNHALRWALGALVALLAWTMQGMAVSNRDLTRGIADLRETLIETRTMLQSLREHQASQDARLDRLETRLEERK